MPHRINSDARPEPRLRERVGVDARLCGQVRHRADRSSTFEADAKEPRGPRRRSLRPPPQARSPRGRRARRGGEARGVRLWTFTSQLGRRLLQWGHLARRKHFPRLCAPRTRFGVGARRVLRGVQGRRPCRRRGGLGGRLGATAGRQGRVAGCKRLARGRRRAGRRRAHRRRSRRRRSSGGKSFRRGVVVSRPRTFSRYER
mmetsp:Transcript_179/g.656  ORF Transcript_179/g.656 Transcript_179/m.656 type:complete len:201 (+) Transcript_179:1112-1714(+)